MDADLRIFGSNAFFVENPDGSLPPNFIACHEELKIMLTKLFGGRHSHESQSPHPPPTLLLLPQRVKYKKSFIDIFQIHLKRFNRS